MNCHYFKSLALFVLTALLMPLSSFAEEVELNGVTYSLSTESAEVTNGSYSGDIVIPASITYEEVTYPVTSIAKSAFSNQSGMTSITIPASITNIGDGAFECCKGLTSITIEDGNEVFDSRDNCNAIVKTATNMLIVGCQTTVIPESVTSIGAAAFSGQTGLTEITIPSGITAIASDAFKDCTGLTSVTINSLDLVSATRTPKTSFKSIFGENVSNYVLSDEVTTIGSYAFYGCSAMTSFNIPEGVTDIESSAFSMCKGLTSITIPGEVSVLKSHLFYGCSSLTSIDIPESVIEIEGDVFSLCRSLESVNIPGGVTTIGNAAFYGCEKLSSIDLPESVDSIGRDVFSYCLALTSVVIPPSVRHIGNYTFYSCQNLNSVTIGASVTSIGSNVFSYCTQLGVIECYTEVMPEIEDDAFGELDVAGISLLVPEGMEDEYKNHDVWGLFFDDSDDVTQDGGNATGIRSAEFDAQAIEAYDLNGRKQSALQRGLNIIRMTDGTTKKVIVK